MRLWLPSIFNKLIRLYETFSCSKWYDFMRLDSALCGKTFFNPLNPKEPENLEALRAWRCLLWRLIVN